MLTQKTQMDARSILKAIFYSVLARLGVRRLRGHSFFATLMPKPAVIADFGAHRGEFFAALEAEHPVARALLVEADPVLAEPLEQRFCNKADVLNAALVGANNNRPIRFTRSSNLESSSIFSERVAAYCAADQVEVPRIDFAQALRRLGGRVDLAKFDVEGAELDTLQAAITSDLAGCGQLTVEFHDDAPPITRRDVDRLCRRMRSEGYAVVNANWPYVDDVLFVNLRRFSSPGKRFRIRCRIALANALFILRGMFFGGVRLLKRT